MKYIELTYYDWRINHFSARGGFLTAAASTVDGESYRDVLQRQYKLDDFTLGASVKQNNAQLVFTGQDSLDFVKCCKSTLFSPYVTVLFVRSNHHQFNFLASIYIVPCFCLSFTETCFSRLHNGSCAFYLQRADVI